MRKLLAIASFAAVAALAMVPASADDPSCVTDNSNGVALVGAGPALTVSCDYTATGPGSAVPATPNSFRIKVIRAGEVVQNDTYPTLTQPNTYPVNSQAGDTVEITLGGDQGGDTGADCVPGAEGFGGCGTVGVLFVGNNPA